MSTIIESGRNVQPGWKEEKLRGSLGNYWRGREGTRDLLIELEAHREWSVKRKVRDVFWFQTCILEKTSRHSQRTPADYHILNCSILGSCPDTFVIVDAWILILFYFLLASG